MKKNICSVLLAALLVAPLGAMAQTPVTNFHKVDRVTTNANGVTFLRTEGDVPWASANQPCQGILVRLDPRNLEEAELAAFEKIYTQVLLAIGTDRTMRFIDVDCTTDSSALTFESVETRIAQ